MTTVMNFKKPSITMEQNDTGSIEDPEKDHVGKILIYAIPSACLAIILLIILVIGIRQRHCLMEKWTSIRRMKNTDPKFYLTSGLRRDSEFNSSAPPTDENTQEYCLTRKF